MVASKPSKAPKVSQPDTSDNEELSKMDRKLEKKVQFYTKVKDTVAFLNSNKNISKKSSQRRNRQKQLKAYNLSGLLEDLPDLKKPRLPATKKKLSCKARQKFIGTEGKQLLSVINHPTYQSNPLLAIQRHLENTQPVIEEERNKKPNINGSKKRKNKSRASIAKAMEI